MADKDAGGPSSLNEERMHVKSSESEQLGSLTGSSSGSATSSTKERIKDYENRISNAQKVPFLPVSNGKKKRMTRSKSPQRRFQPKVTRIPRSKTADDLAKGQGPATNEAKDNVKHNDDKENNDFIGSAISGVWGRPLDSAADDYIQSVFHLRSGNVTIDTHPLKYLPPHFPPAPPMAGPREGEGDGKTRKSSPKGKAGMLRDAINKPKEVREAFGHVMDPYGDPFAPRHVYEALDQYQTACTEVVFPQGQTVPEPGKESREVEFAQDEIYYYPETGEEEGSKGNCGIDDDRETKDWWKYVRGKKPPDFIASRPNPVLAYLAFRHPRTNPGIKLGSSPNPTPPPTPDSEAYRFVFTFRGLKIMGNPYLEPLHCELFIVDVATRQRVSETFRVAVDGKGVASAAHSCLFSVERPRASLCLVARVTRRLTGDSNTFEFLYTKGQGSAKEMKRHLDAVDNAGKHLERFSQGFGFGWTPLFARKERRDKGSNVLTFIGSKPISIQLGLPTRPDEVSLEWLCDTIMQYKVKRKLSALKSTKAVITVAGQPMQKKWTLTDAIHYLHHKIGHDLIDANGAPVPAVGSQPLPCIPFGASERAKRARGGASVGGLDQKPSVEVPPNTERSETGDSSSYGPSSPMPLSKFIDLSPTPVTRLKALSEEGGTVEGRGNENPIAPSPRIPKALSAGRQGEGGAEAASAVAKTDIIKSSPELPNASSLHSTGENQSQQRERGVGVATSMDESGKTTTEATSSTAGENDDALGDGAAAGTAVDPAEAKKEEAKDDGVGATKPDAKLHTPGIIQNIHTLPLCTYSQPSVTAKVMVGDAMTGREDESEDAKKKTRATATGMDDSAATVTFNESASSNKILEKSKEGTRGGANSTTVESTPSKSVNGGVESAASLIQREDGENAGFRSSGDMPHAETLESFDNLVPFGDAKADSKSDPNVESKADSQEAEKSFVVVPKMRTSTPTPTEQSNLAKSNISVDVEGGGEATVVPRSHSGGHSLDQKPSRATKANGEKVEMVTRDKGNDSASSGRQRPSIKLAKDQMSHHHSTTITEEGGSSNGTRDKIHAPILPAAPRHLVAEMRELPMEGMAAGPAKPACRYSNCLYIYPQALSISTHRNLTVMTELCDRDQPSAKGLPAIFTYPGQPLDRAHFAAMTYHLRRPKFFEEVKVALPNHLSPTHHIRFTFYNVSLKTLKRGAGHTNASLSKLTKIIGFAFLPLLRGGRPLDEFYHLRVYSSLPHDYIFAESKLRQSPAQTKDLFTVRATLMSSLFTNDPHVSAFFSAMESLHFPVESTRSAASSSESKAGAAAATTTTTSTTTFTSTDGSASKSVIGKRKAVDQEDSSEEKKQLNSSSEQATTPAGVQPSAGSASSTAVATSMDPMPKSAGGAAAAAEGRGRQGATKFKSGAAGVDVGEKKDKSLHERLYLTTLRSPSVTERLQREANSTPVLCSECLHSGPLSKRGQISNWVARWFILRKRKQSSALASSSSGGGGGAAGGGGGSSAKRAKRRHPGYELVYFSDATAMAEEARVVCGELKEGTVVRRAMDKQSRKYPNLVVFNLLLPTSDTPIQIGCGSTAELRTWREAFAQAILEQRATFQAISSVCRGKAHVLAQFLPTLLRQMFRVLCYTSKKATRVSIFSSILRLFHSIQSNVPNKTSGGEKRRGKSNPRAPRRSGSASSQGANGGRSAGEGRSLLLEQFANYLFRDYAMEEALRLRERRAATRSNTAGRGDGEKAAGKEKPRKKLNTETSTSSSLAPNDNSDSVYSPRRGGGGSPLWTYKALCIAWNETSDRRTLNSASEFSWLLLRIFYKSMVFHAEHCKATQQPNNITPSGNYRFLTERTLSKMRSMLLGLAEIVTARPRSGGGSGGFMSGRGGGVTRETDRSSFTERPLESGVILNRSLSIFFRDCYQILDRGLVTDIVATYIQGMTNHGQNASVSGPAILDDRARAEERKCELLMVLSSHPHFEAIAAPSRLSRAMVGCLNSVTAEADEDTLRPQSRIADLARKFTPSSSLAVGVPISEPGEEGDGGKTKDSTSARRIPYNTPNDLGLEGRAGTALAASPPERGHFYFRLLAAELRGCLRRRRVLAPDTPVSLRPLEDIAAVLRSLAADNVQREIDLAREEEEEKKQKKGEEEEEDGFGGRQSDDSHSKGMNDQNAAGLGDSREKSSTGPPLSASSPSGDFHPSPPPRSSTATKHTGALLAQAFLPIIRVMWRQTKAMATIKGTRALKDLLLILIYVVRTVPASWIRVALETPGSLIYIPTSERPAWLQQMMRLCTLVLEEFVHRSALATNILPPPRKDVAPPLPVRCSILKSMPGLGGGGKKKMGKRGSVKIGKTAGTIPAGMFRRALEAAHGDSSNDSQRREEELKAGSNRSSHQRAYSLISRNLAALNLEIPTTAVTEMPSGASSSENTRSKKAMDTKAAECGGGDRASSTAASSNNALRKDLAGLQSSGLRRRASTIELSSVPTNKQRSRTPNQSPPTNRHKRDISQSLQDVEKRAIGISATHAEARERQMREEIRQKTTSRFRQRDASHPYSKASRVFFAEACQVVLDLITDIIVPLCDDALGDLSGKQPSASKAERERRLHEKNTGTPIADARVGIYDEADMLLDCDGKDGKEDWKREGGTTRPRHRRDDQQQQQQRLEVVQHSQSAVLRFLLSMLRADTSVRVRRRTCMTVSWLMCRYQSTFIPLSVPPKLDIDKLSKSGQGEVNGSWARNASKIRAISSRVEWEANLRYLWFSFLRQTACPGPLQKDALGLLYQLCQLTHRKYGTATPFRKAAIEGFGDVVHRVLKLRRPLEMKQPMPPLLEKGEGIDGADSSYGAGGGGADSSANNPLFSNLRSPHPTPANPKDLRELSNKVRRGSLQADAKVGGGGDERRFSVGDMDVKTDLTAVAMTVGSSDTPRSGRSEHTQESSRAYPESIETASDPAAGNVVYACAHSLWRVSVRSAVAGSKGGDGTGGGNAFFDAGSSLLADDKVSQSHFRLLHATKRGRQLQPEEVLLKGLGRVIYCARAAEAKDARQRRVTSGYLAASLQVSKLFGRMARVLQLLRSPFRRGKKQFSLREMIAWRYNSIIQAYEDSPDLQFYYQTRLKQFHERNGDIVEAAVVASQIADRAISMSIQRLCVVLIVGSPLHPPSTAYHLLSIGIGGSSGAVQAEQADTFTKMTRAASRLYEKACYAERAVQQERKLASFHEARQSYNLAAEAHARIAQLLGDIYQYETGRLDRSLGTYYRVEFFGSARVLHHLRASLPPPPSGRVEAGGVSGLCYDRPTLSVRAVEGATRFVFRERKITRLMEICTRLKAIESLIPGKVVILQDAGEEKSLRPDELGIKVTKLDPVSDDVHDAILKKGTLAQKRGSCLYHQNAECRRFVFETPFTKSGRAHAKSTAEQYLRRTICTVVERFPTSEKLQPIVSEEHVDLEPIEAATKAIRFLTPFSADDKRFLYLSSSGLIVWRESAGFDVEGLPPRRASEAKDALSSTFRSGKSPSTWRGYRGRSGVLEGLCYCYLQNRARGAATRSWLTLIRALTVTDLVLILMSSVNCMMPPDVLIRFMDIAKKALRVARKTLEHRPTAERSTKDASVMSRYLFAAAAAIEEEAKDMEFQNLCVCEHPFMGKARLIWNAVLQCADSGGAFRRSQRENETVLRDRPNVHSKGVSARDYRRGGCCSRSCAIFSERGG
eukprot:jgi/Bigna1/80887/fgenesh1_pg.75_\